MIKKYWYYPVILVLSLACIFLIYSKINGNKKIDSITANYNKKISELSKKSLEERQKLLSEVKTLNISIKTHEKDKSVSEAKIKVLEKKIKKILTPPESANIGLECQKILQEARENFHLLKMENDEYKNIIEKLLKEVKTTKQKGDELFQNCLAELEQSRFYASDALKKQDIKIYKLKKEKKILIIVAIAALSYIIIK